MMNESAPPHESLGMRRDELSPDVRTYADNLWAQIQVQLMTLGIRTKAEREQAILSGQLTAEAVQPLLDRIELLKRVAETNKVEFFETLTEQQLRDQYETQMKLYRDTGILQLSGNDMAFTDYKGEQRLAPSLEDVLALVAERSPELRAKVEQGFTRVVLVPTGARIGTRTKDATGNFTYTGLLGAYVQLLRHKARKGELFYSDTDDQGKPKPIPAGKFNTKEPVYTWDKLLDGDVNQTIAYGPSAFDANQDPTQLTKEHYLKDAKFPGWQVLLIEGDWNAPKNGTLSVVGNRTRLDGLGSGQVPISDPDNPQQTTPSLHEWLTFYQTKGNDPASPYFQERPIGTLEAYLTVALIRLQETGQVMGDYDGADKYLYLLEQYVKAEGGVPCGFFRRDGGLADLGGFVPGVRNDDAVGLSSVSIG